MEPNCQKKEAWLGLEDCWTRAGMFQGFLPPVLLSVSLCVLCPLTPGSSPGAGNVSLGAHLTSLF